MYIQSRGRYGQGSTYFKADNPDFGAVFTLYLKEVPKTLQKIRQEKEKKLFKDGAPIPQPSDEKLRIEEYELDPYLIFTITDSTNNTVRKITSKAKEGIQRAAWDLKFQRTSPITANSKFKPTKQLGSGTLVLPGVYKVSVSIVTRDGEKFLDGPEEFTVKALNNTTLPAIDREAMVTFQKKADNIARVIRGTLEFLNEIINRVDKIKDAVINTPDAPADLMISVNNLDMELEEIKLKFQRSSNRPSSEENPPSPVTFDERLSTLSYTHWRSTSTITSREKESMEILLEEFPPIYERIKYIYEYDIKNIEKQLEKFGAPWTTGRLPELNIK
jgi:hypothetical protein